MATGKRQLKVDEHDLDRLNSGKHLSTGFTKKRQEAYNTRDKGVLEKRIQKNRTKSKSKEDTSSEDHKNKIALKKKKINEMTNVELKSLNERLRLEREFKSLAREDLSPGRRFVEDLFKNNAKQTASSYVSKYMSENLNQLMKEATK